MADGPQEENDGEANLDDVAHVIAYCTSRRAVYPGLSWDEVEPLLEQGWSAARGSRSTAWGAVREMAHAHWLQPLKCERD
jgi:hypothetical protein